MIKTYPLVMDLETHAKYEEQAKKQGKSLKDWIFEALEEKFRKENKNVR